MALIVLCPASFVAYCTVAEETALISTKSMHLMLHPSSLQKNHLGDRILLHLTRLCRLHRRRPHKIKSRIQTVNGLGLEDRPHRTNQSEVAVGRDEEDEADGV